MWVPGEREEAPRRSSIKVRACLLFSANICRSTRPLHVNVKKRRLKDMQFRCPSEMNLIAGDCRSFVPDIFEIQAPTVPKTSIARLLLVGYPFVPIA